jgi:ribosomal protein L18E
MSIKNRIYNIELNIKETNKGLNDNKKDCQMLRSECATLEHNATENCNDILKEILEDISNFEKDYRKLQQSDINETTFLKQ